MQQKALIVTHQPGRTHGLDDLNIALQRGWRVVHLVPMGGAGAAGHGADTPPCFAALVVIERAGAAEAELMEQVEELAEEVPDEALDNLVDGDGASVDLDDV